MIADPAAAARLRAEISELLANFEHEEAEARMNVLKQQILDTLIQ